MQKQYICKSSVSEMLHTAERQKRCRQRFAFCVILKAPYALINDEPSHGVNIHSALYKHATTKPLHPQLPCIQGRGEVRPYALSEILRLLTLSVCMCIQNSALRTYRLCSSRTPYRMCSSRGASRAGNRFEEKERNMRMCCAHHSTDN